MYSFYLQEGGSTHVLPTQRVIRVVLLDTERIVQRFLGSTVCKAKKIGKMVCQKQINWHCISRSLYNRKDQLSYI